MAALRRPRHFRERKNWLEELSDKEVIQRYRLDRGKIGLLHGLIQDDIRPKTDRSHAIPALTKLLIALQFLAKGEFYSEGGLSHGISKSSVCRCFWQVIDAIDRKLHNIIFKTDQNSIATLKQKFYRIANIPNCVGAIDGTLIPIIAPTDREDIYVCRKGYHAINVQAIVDSDMRFLNVVAKWPGSTHDNVIFENSRIKQWLENRNNGWLVGDSGYALKTYLLTPKLNPVTRQEEIFNTAHSRTRIVVERAFGLLKSRFRCLHKTGGCLQFTPQKSAKVFVVCTKLHNLCLGDGGIEQPDLDNNNNNENNNDININVEDNAQRVREALINSF